MSVTRLIAAAALALAFGASPQASAHTRLKATGAKLKPRSDSSGLKEPAPCGPNSTVDEAKRVTLVAGADLDVAWEETIHHPGSFRIAFSPDGTKEAFEANVLKTVTHGNTDDPAPPNYNDPKTYVQLKATVKVPAVTCDKCVIQMIQIMTDRTPPTNYYSCADVKIVPEGTVVDEGDGAVEPTASDTTPPAETSGSASASGSAAAPVKPATPTGLKLKVTKGS